jgi:hypothetical protein
MLGLCVASRGEVFIEDHLGDAGAVAEVEKDEVAVVAPPVHPSHHNDTLARVRGAQFAKSVRALKCSEKIEQVVILFPCCRNVPQEPENLG